MQEKMKITTSLKIHDEIDLEFVLEGVECVHEEGRPERERKSSSRKLKSVDPALLDRFCSIETVSQNALSDLSCTIICLSNHTLFTFVELVHNHCLSIDFKA